MIIATSWVELNKRHHQCCKNQSFNKHVLKLSFLKRTSEKNLPPIIKSIQSAYEIARFEMHTHLSKILHKRVKGVTFCKRKCGGWKEEEGYYHPKKSKSSQMSEYKWFFWLKKRDKIWFLFWQNIVDPCVSLEGFRTPSSKQASVGPSLSSHPGPAGNFGSYNHGPYFIQQKGHAQIWIFPPIFLIKYSN